MDVWLHILDAAKAMTAALHYRSSTVFSLLNKYLDILTRYGLWQTDVFFLISFYFRV